MVTSGSASNLVLDEGERRIIGEDTSGKGFYTVMPAYDAELIDTLINRNVQFQVKAPEGRSLWQAILVNTLPILLFIGVWIYLMRQS